MSLDEIEELECDSSSLLGSKKSGVVPVNSANQALQRYTLYLTEFEHPLHLYYPGQSVHIKGSLLSQVKRTKKVVLLGKSGDYFVFRLGSRRWVSPAHELSHLFKSRGIRPDARQHFAVAHRP